MVVTEDPYQGEDAAELVAVDYDPLPAVVTRGTRRPRRDAAVPRGRHQHVIGRFGDAEPDPNLFDGCEVVVSRDDREPAGRAGPDGVPGRRRGLGRGRPADRVDPQPGRAGHQGRAGRAAGPRARGPGAGDHPGRGRRVRREVRRRPRARRWSPGWPGSSAGPPAGRETRYENLLGDDPRPGAGADRHDRRPAGRHGARLPARGAAGRRRVPADRRAPAVADPADDPGARTTSPRVESCARSVVTNTTPIGAYRGAGRPEATAAIERAMDLFAAEIGMDPAEVRRRNLLAPFTEPHRPTASARCTTAATTRPRWTGCWRRPAYDGAARGAGRAAGPRRRGAARHRAGLLRRDHRRRRRVRPAAARTPPIEVHPDGSGHDPDRHLAARAGPRRRRGRCWPARSSASRSRRSR